MEGIQFLTNDKGQKRRRPDSSQEIRRTLGGPLRQPHRSPTRSRAEIIARIRQEAPPEARFLASKHFITPGHPSEAALRVLVNKRFDPFADRPLC